MSENMVYAAFFMPAAAAVLVFGMKYISAAVQAWLRAGQDEAYRALAEQATAAQAQTTATLASIQARLAAIEKILKDVG
jgi:hypothetical protein